MLEEGFEVRYAYKFLRTKYSVNGLLAKSAADFTRHFHMGRVTLQGDSPHMKINTFNAYRFL